jgi:hypothetical protein
VQVGYSQAGASGARDSAGDAMVDAVGRCSLLRAVELIGDNSRTGYKVLGCLDAIDWAVD